ncbi:MAG: UTP--glucose-1-phosphate uridylyltransferase GalU [Hyphomicrobiales bacterium]|nr:UTP--glucose-1-phosphate uridylyltransferase GalU [Rickettsiales bacterium]MCP5362277.1 UTP--glucose-1-phosphate uridylyltransferase GalU [Hyphomicrobiales bacterium]
MSIQSGSHPVKKAVFPVGGLGTRFLPATRAMPKEMLPVFDKPLIQYAYEEALAAGIEQFIFVTGRNKGIISDHFDHAFELEQVLAERGKTDALKLARDWLPEAGQVAFIRQQEPLGLGHAVYCARHLIGDEPFAVLLADEMLYSNPPFLKQMVDRHAQTGGCVVALDEVPQAHVNRYGIIRSEESGACVRLQGMVEKPPINQAPSRLAIVGRYILTPDVFTYLAEGRRGSGNEIQLTDAMIRSLDAGTPYYGLRFEGQRFDCGSKLGFLEATISMALADGISRAEVQQMLQRLAGEPGA